MLMDGKWGRTWSATVTGWRQEGRKRVTRSIQVTVDAANEWMARSRMEVEALRQNIHDVTISEFEEAR